MNDIYKQPEQAERHGSIERLIRRYRPDVFFGQGIYASTVEEMQLAVRRLADATRMDCWVPGQNEQPGAYAVASGNHDQGVCVLWRGPTTPIPGSCQVYTPDAWWHALVGVTLLMDGLPVDCMAYHGRPPTVGEQDENEVAVEQEQIGEARRLAQIVAAEDANPFTIVGAGWDFLLADRLPDDSYYYPQQVLPAELSAAARKLAISRQPGNELWLAELSSVAARLRIMQPPYSTGYSMPGHGHLDYGKRMVDECVVTPEAAVGAVAHRVFATSDVQRLSPHLPVMCTFDTRRFSRAARR